MNTPTSQNSRAAFPLRMPDVLRHWLAQEAAKNRRSQNAELVHRLEQMRQHEQEAPQV
jgi:hypothetical protein